MPTLRQGATGGAVAELHRLLRAAGALAGPVTTEERSQFFGLDTLAAVGTLQKLRGLTPDGIAGPLTLAVLRGLDGPPPEYERAPHAVARRLLELAHEDLLRGRREDPPGSNRGADIEPLLRGWKGRHGDRYARGALWCGLWIDYHACAAYEEAGIPYPMARWYVASASGLLRAARGRDAIMPIGGALPGDIGIVLGDADPKHGGARLPSHVCLISGHDGDRVISMDANQVTPAIKFRHRVRGDFAAAVRLPAR